MNPELFTHLGLEEKAAKIYLAGLELGTTSVQELARKSGLKRPTVYLHLDELLRKGLFEKSTINNKTYYQAAEPEELEIRLKKSLETLQSELPRLAALRSHLLGKPEVRVFEGEEGIRRIYEEVKRANSLRIWSNLGELGSFHNAYFDIAEAIREGQIGAREIVSDTKTSRRYAKLLQKSAGQTYGVRVATAEGFENDSIIYGNVVALFRLSGLNTFVVRIEDATIAETMRALFDMAWKSAKPLT